MKSNMPILVDEFSRFANDQIMELSVAPRFVAGDMNHYEFWVGKAMINGRVCGGQSGGYLKGLFERDTLLENRGNKWVSMRIQWGMWFQELMYGYVKSMGRWKSKKCFFNSQFWRRNWGISRRIQRYSIFQQSVLGDDRKWINPVTVAATGSTNLRTMVQGLEVPPTDDQPMSFRRADQKPAVSSGKTTWKQLLHTHLHHVHPPGHMARSSVLSFEPSPSFKTMLTIILT